MLRWMVAIVVSGLVLGCIPKQKPQNYRVFATSLAHFDERGRFWRCAIDLGMSGDELLSECGDPHVILDVANSDDICVAYNNMAHSLRAANPHAPYVAVCLEKGSFDPENPKKFTKESLDRWLSTDFYTKMRGGHVSSTYGLKNTAIKSERAPSKRVDPDSKRSEPEAPADER